MIHYNEGMREGKRQVQSFIDVSLHNAAEHEALMRAITTAIRHSMMLGESDKYIADAGKLVPLVDLLQSLIPEEDELQTIKAYHTKKV